MTVATLRLVRDVTGFFGIPYTAILGQLIASENPLYVGTEEILLRANLLLYQRAVDGAPISLVVGRGQFHDWPLAGLPINSAAPLVRRDIYRQLGLLPDTAITTERQEGVSASINCNPITDHCGGDEPVGAL